MEEEKKKINLFTKPSWQDWIMLFVIIMAIAMVYFYRIDMNNLRTYYQTICICPTNKIVSQIQLNITNFSNLTNLTLIK